MNQGKRNKEKKEKIMINQNVVGAYTGRKSVVEFEEQESNLMMILNLKSAFVISNHVARQVVSYKSGKIIHISSRNGFSPLGNDSTYSASKSGLLLRLVESFA